ncbi:MAG: UDP-N-acetylenolpyruvoylglucosamine reductase [Actinomycetota bacterium]|jgi:UDP-N-acetylmuramate dehydrogenase|nr:MAG: UDP-N-acetylenolpyruvoylglucosamine reductase [Actinomycetota bacterium]
MATEEALAVAERVLRAACGDRVRVGFPLAPLTTFRLGGPAALYLEAEGEDDLDAAALAIAEAEIPWLVLGKGSNVLVADEGFPGLVLRLGRSFRWAGRAGERLAAGGAMPLPALAGIALRHGLAGLEFGVAIPGSLGGAVRMNAGAHGTEIAAVLTEVRVVRLVARQRRAIAARDIDFGYRRAGLAPDAVVTEATVRLEPGDPAVIRERMEAARSWRRRTQPLAEPNCGSVFTNPPGAHAARLIEEAGAKGLAEGGARVSDKHANFIVAGPGARARDVARLIERVRSLVRDRTGVELVPEVRLVGRFGDGP